MDKNVFLPGYLADGVKPLKNHYPRNVNLFAFDTETAQGEPYLLTFNDGREISFIDVSKNTVLDRFFEYLESHCTKSKRVHWTNLLYAHNLQFDLTAILSQRETEIFRFLHPPQVEHKNGTIKVYCGKTWFAQVRLKNGTYVKVLDSANFIKGSLYDISRSLALTTSKPKRPYFVENGRAPRNKDEWWRLRGYCRAEIMAQYELAQFILRMHEQYNCGICVSASQLSSKVFRRHYLKSLISQVPPYLRSLVEKTIHGGRASAFTPTPTVIPNVRMYDYNSFYPWAMTKLPSITSGEWKETACFVDEREGFYLVTGYVHQCRYPILLRNSHSFDYANGEKVIDAPVPSYELREAIKCREIDLQFARGYVWIPDGNAENPFKDYVSDFYSKKNATAKDHPLYVTYKLLLNTLYGKTFQAVRQTDYEEEPEQVWNESQQRAVRNRIMYRAGGLYLPHVASWITSMCRAKLHSDLHRYNGIDCATDSFKTTQKIHETDALGGLKLDCEGLLLLIRSKVYVVFSREVQNEAESHGDLRQYLQQNLERLDLGKDVVRYASHGFWGTLRQLLELYVEKGTEYPVPHMVKIREAIRQSKQARVMETQRRHIGVNWENEYGFCGQRKAQAMIYTDSCTDNCFTCAHNTFAC
ncbi:DNA polymerase [Candidatus Bathyarchaeota archaeon]|nr:DNA polymerase [Candidatus Bathyarchaeota archaeon]